MPKARHFFVALSCVAILVIWAVTVLHADISEADVREINQYRLTEKALGQFGHATKSLIELAHTKPDVFETVKKKTTNNEDVAGLVEYYTKSPDVSRAIQSSGMTVHDYVYFEFALIYAATGNVVLKAGGKLPDGFSKVNVEFFRTHEPDFKKLDQDMKTLGRLLEGNSISSEEEDESDDEHR